MSPHVPNIDQLGCGRDVSTSGGDILASKALKGKCANQRSWRVLPRALRIRPFWGFKASILIFPKVTNYLSDGPGSSSARQQLCCGTTPANLYILRSISRGLFMMIDVGMLSE